MKSQNEKDPMSSPRIRAIGFFALLVLVCSELSSAEDTDRLDHQYVSGDGFK
jgi:hypothetical protein